MGIKSDILSLAVHFRRLLCAGLMLVRCSCITPHADTRQSLSPAVHIMFMFSSEMLLPLSARRSIVCARSQHLLPDQPMGMCISSAVIARFVHNFLYVYLFSFDDLQLSPYRTQHIRNMPYTKSRRSQIDCDFAHFLPVSLWLVVFGFRLLPLYSYYSSFCYRITLLF